jgi:sugar porter (SP) family MFS transporter
MADTPMLDPNQDQGSRTYVYVVSAVAAVGGLLFGFDTAVISGAIGFVKDQFGLDAIQEGFVVSCILIGCIAGALVAGPISDRVGRKKVLIATAAVYAISAIFSGLARNTNELIAARFLGGIAVGVSSMVSPTYIAEVAPAAIRGRLVSLQQLAIVTGILLAYFSNWLLVDIPENNWRWMFASEAVPSLALLIAVLFIPDSPRWLAKQDRDEEALSVLTRIGGPRHAERELADIRSTLAVESGSMLELLRPGLRIALLIGVVLAILQQITGINTIIYYAPKVFEYAGFNEASSALFATVLVGVMNFVITMISLAIIDRVGRKVLMMIGSAGMGLCLAAAALFLSNDSLPGWLKVAIVLGYIGFFGLGVGGVVWVVIAEIFPNKTRGRAVAAATAVLWVSCFAVSQTFPLLIEIFKTDVFWIYAAMCLIMFLFVSFVVPETKNKSLEDIERMWRGEPGRVHHER